MIEYKQLIVPMVLFVFVAIVAVIALALFFRYLNRRLAMQTVRHVLASEQSVDPLLIEAIVKEKADKNPDLRKGALLVAAAFAFAVLGYIFKRMDHAEIFNALVGVAAFPGLTGLTYLAFHFTDLDQ